MGLTLVAVGESIRLWAVRHIGVISRTRSDRLGPLVANGPFRYLRNPLYLGNILLWLGFALSARLPWLVPICVVVLASQSPCDRVLGGSPARFTPRPAVSRLRGTRAPLASSLADPRGRGQGRSPYTHGATRSSANEPRWWRSCSATSCSRSSTPGAATKGPRRTAVSVRLRKRPSGRSRPSGGFYLIETVRATSARTSRRPGATGV